MAAGWCRACSLSSMNTQVRVRAQANGGKFTGLKLRLRKETEDRMAPYIVEKA